jgi:hypothetical protein
MAILRQRWASGRAPLPTSFIVIRGSIAPPALGLGQNPIRASSLPAMDHHQMIRALRGGVLLHAPFVMLGPSHRSR